MRLPVLYRWLGGLPIVFLLALVALHKDKEIRTEIWIERPPAAVWQILTTTDEYPSWNPFIRHLRGQLQPGNRIEVEIGPSGSDTMTFRPVVLTVEPEREIRWLGSVWMRGLFDGEHGFRLESSGGRTHLIQSEHFSGVLVGRLSDGILRETEVGFAAMDEALKARAESR
jgi:hypothetical protein